MRLKRLLNKFPELIKRDGKTYRFTIRRITYNNITYWIVSYINIKLQGDRRHSGGHPKLYKALKQCNQALNKYHYGEGHA